MIWEREKQNAIYRNKGGRECVTELMRNKRNERICVRLRMDSGDIFFKYINPGKKN